MIESDKQELAAILARYHVREACLAMEEGGLIFIKCNRPHHNCDYIGDLK